MAIDNDEFEELEKRFKELQEQGGYESGSEEDHESDSEEELHFEKIQEPVEEPVKDEKAQLLEELEESMSKAEPDSEEFERGEEAADDGEKEQIDEETREELIERARKKHEKGMRMYEEGLTQWEELYLGDTSELDELGADKGVKTPKSKKKKTIATKATPKKKTKRTPASKKRRHIAWPWVAGALVILAAGGAAWFFLHRSSPVLALHSSSPKAPTLMDLVPAKLQAEFKPGEAHEDLGAVGAKDCYQFAAMMATNKDYLQTKANMLKDKGPGIIQGNLKACSSLVYRPKLIEALQKIRAQVLWQPRDGINTAPGFRQAYWRWLIAGTFVPGKTGSWDVKGCPAQIRYVLDQKGYPQVSGVISQTVAACLAKGAKAAPPPVDTAEPEAEQSAAPEAQSVDTAEQEKQEAEQSAAPEAQSVDTAEKKEEQPKATTRPATKKPVAPKKPKKTRETPTTVKPKPKKKQRPIAKKKAWQKKADDAMDAYFKQH